MMKIPPQAEKALAMLNDAGYQAFIVGGIVRNSLMGLEVSDIDITTDALPQQTAEVFKDCHVTETGLRHGTITVHIDNLPIEITTYRTESRYTDNRHPDSVCFTTSLEEDCARRDFTMNAVCYNPKTGIVDFYNGTKDIKDKIIRCVGDSDIRFQEDALRILRAIRFASVLGFEIEEKTRQAIFNNSKLLKNISAERIYAELNKMLRGKNIRKILMEYTEILAVIMPEILAMKNFHQQNPHHIYDVLEHTAVAVENCPPIPQLRLAALLHDMGKPDCFTVDEDNVGHFYGHGEISYQHAKNILTRLKVSNDDYTLISRLVKYHDSFIQPDEKSVRRALNKHGEQFLRMLVLLKRADNARQNIQMYNRKDEYDKLDKVIDTVIESQQCFSLKQLAVNGSDLISLGIPPSSEMGRILKSLLDMVINGEAPNEKDVLLSKIPEITTYNNVL